MKRKTSNLLIVLLCFLIFLLIALAFFMTWLVEEQHTFLETHMQELQANNILLEENGTFDMGRNVQEPTHSFIFVGDSRTVGMEDAVLNLHPLDSCTFIGKVGEGYYWLANEGLEQLSDALESAPNSTVIFNLGVNDLKEVSLYLKLYPQIFSNYEKASFYIMSVNPVGEECIGVSNDDIEAFNQRMEEAFPERFLDCYHYLETSGFSTVDELHYTNDSYRAVHDYVVSALSDK